MFCRLGLYLYFSVFYVLCFLVLVVCLFMFLIFDVDLLRSAISNSRLCQPDTWPADIDAMAALYNDELGNVRDSILPIRVFIRRPRPTDPWFDRECRDAKRTTRRLERAFASANRRAASAVAAPLDGTASGVTATAAISKAAAAKATWYNQRRLYRQLGVISVPITGETSWRLTRLIHKGCGSLSTPYLGAVVNQLARQLTSH